jgi:nucleoside-diphosphate-sugar epimerase
VQGIIHTASVVNFSPDPNVVIPQTISGVTSLLASASNEPSVKSFVYTSSSVAAISAGSNEDESIDDSTWNNAQIKESWSVTVAPFPSTHSFAVYGASKAEAELALWKYVKDEQPSFQVNSILPDANFGELLSLKGSLSTGGWVRSVFENGVDFVKTLPPGKL